MVRAAIYIRVSTEEQVVNGLSLEAQREALTSYAQERGMRIVDVYADEGITARKKLKSRKELQRLLDDVKADKIDVILVTKLDRWFRNIKDYYAVQEILEAHNCNWRTIFENYDTSTAAGRLHINIMLSVNQDECDRTSERIKAVFKHKRENKEVCSGAVPFGYYIDENKHMQINEKEAEIIRDTFNYYELHNNIAETREYISNKHGYVNYTTTRTRLAREAYIGTYSGIKDFCPAIITAKQFKNVQRLLGMNKKDYKGGPGKHEYIFSGMLRCKYCGRVMAANTQNRPAGPYRMYRCHGCKRDHICDNGYTIPEKILERHIFSHIRTELEQYKATFEIEKKEAKKHDTAPQIAKLKKKLDKIKELYLEDLIDKDTYKKDFASLNNQIAELEEKSTVPGVDIDAINTVLNSDFCGIYGTLQSNEKRFIWQSIIDYIEIGKDRFDITIHFK